MKPETPIVKSGASTQTHANALPVMAAHLDSALKLAQLCQNEDLELRFRAHIAKEEEEDDDEVQDPGCCSTAPWTLTREEKLALYASLGGLEGRYPFPREEEEEEQSVPKGEEESSPSESEGAVLEVPAASAPGAAHEPDRTPPMNWTPTTEATVPPPKEEEPEAPEEPLPPPEEKSREDKAEVKTQAQEEAEAKLLAMESHKLHGKYCQLLRMDVSVATVKQTLERRALDTIWVDDYVRLLQMHRESKVGDDDLLNRKFRREELQSAKDPPKINKVTILRRSMLHARL